MKAPWEPWLKPDFPPAVNFEPFRTRKPAVKKDQRRSVNKRSVKRLRGAAAPGSARNILARQKQAQAVELRIGGATFQQIADLLGYRSHGGAREAVMAALPKTSAEAGKKLRLMELERWRALWLAMFPLAQRGDTKAAAVCVRLMKRKAEMEGTDAPKRVRVKGQVDSHFQGQVIKVYGGFSPEDLLRVNGNGNGALPPGS